MTKGEVLRTFETEKRSIEIEELASAALRIIICPGDSHRFLWVIALE